MLVSNKKKESKKLNTASKKKSDAPRIAYRYRCYPSIEQVIYFARVFGCCRFLWNRYVDDESFFYAVMGEHLNNTPADYKEDYPFLAEVDSYALCNVQLDYQRALNSFLKGITGYPKFKKKGRCRDSYTTNFCKGNIVLQGDRLRLPKLPGGTLKLCLHRCVPAGLKLKSVTISREPDGAYYASILYEEPATATPEIITPEHMRAIGLDMSLPDFFISSDDTEAHFIKCFKQSEERLAKAQRDLSRMQEGSKNYEKQKLRVAKIHAEIKHQRKDLLNKLSTRLVDFYDVICIEDLNMHAMAQCMNFGKTINDNGWGMFVDMLEYKCRRAGKYLVKIDRWFPSSQTCFDCGYKNPEVKDMSVTKWDCPVCGAHHYRDKNAANNIRREGIKMLFPDFVYPSNGVKTA